jgi:hypothetical protein
MRYAQQQGKIALFITKDKPLYACQVTIILSGDDNYLSDVKRCPQMGSRIAGNVN